VEPGRFERFLVLALLSAGAAVLWWLDPATTEGLPACPWWSLTGTHCPGCGSTRALHQLLHGNPLRALGHNPLLVLTLPCVGYWVARYLLAGWRIELPELRPRAGAIYAFAGAVVLFWILRNLPGEPWVHLAP
jgi:hypothetical protein